MSASIMEASSFCSTCLSQGRKMFPFPLNFIQRFATLYKDLKVTARDMICWECKSFIAKMATFRRKALMAQANLATLRKKPMTVLQTLSKLSISKGIYLEITEDPESQSDPLHIGEGRVKSEIDMDIDHDDSDEHNYIADENIDIGHVKVEISDGKNEIGDENIIFQVYQHKTLVPVSDNRKVTTDVRKDDGIGNATLMSLLARKSTQLSFPSNEAPTPTTSVPEDNLNTERHQESTNILPKDSQTVNLFTEERLTEEEMRRWWESKRENEFYAKSIPVFRCEKCVEPFFTRRSFLGHEKMHTEMYGEESCDICELRFRTESGLAAHKDSHYRLLKCGYCSQKWDNPNSMRRHCYTEHRVPVTVWDCDVCPKQLPTHARYLNHIKAHRAEPCPSCGRKVNTSSMRAHLLTHKPNSVKKFECADCGSKFRTKCLLKSHILCKHKYLEADRRAFCKDCNKQYRNMSSYITHMKLSSKHVAADQLRHICDECQRAFVTIRSLRRHVEATHSDQRNYPCQQCSESFRTTSARARHRRVAHEGYVAPRDEICDHCGKSFQTKGQLSIHMNTHTGARPFVCKLCGADFGHRSALYLHGRYKHKIQKIKKNDKFKSNSGKDNSIKDSVNDNSEKDNVDT